MTKPADFDELVGRDLPEAERERLRHAHELLVQAGPPPELSPELEKVPWPEDALAPLWGKRKEKVPLTRRPLFLAAGFATAVVIGIVIGQGSGASPNSIDAQRSVELRGTALDRDAIGTLQLGKRDEDGNWPMVLRVKGLNDLPEGGYYDLYLTRDGEPRVLCGTFDVNDGEVVVRLSAAYDLSRFDRNGWVVTRQPPGHHEPDQIVLKPRV
jgi:hypothetical protein